MKKIIAIVIILNSFIFAENNITIIDAYYMAKEEFDRGDKDSSIKYLLLAEKLGNCDAFFNLCWICKHDRNNPLTRKWCAEDECQL